MSRFPDAFMNHRGYFIDKWEQYLGIYDSELAPFVSAGEPVALLEIGVQNGGSLQLWRDYLPKGSKIVGFDINPACENLVLDSDTHVHIVDGTDRAKIDEILKDDMFDIIIDDGSHRSEDIIKTYRALFHRVRGGGKFFIEDLHASYWPSFGGGFREPASAMDFLKGLVDGLNCDHFRETGDTPKAELDHLRDFGHAVAGMTFYDSMAVIAFMEAPRSTPYRRVHGGGETPVVPLPAFASRDKHARLSTVLASRTAARHLDKVLLGQVEELLAAVPTRKPDPDKTEKEALVAENAKLRTRIAALKAKRASARRSSRPFRRLRKFFGGGSRPRR